jgi:hypothetical protein
LVKRECKRRIKAEVVEFSGSYDCVDETSEKSRPSEFAGAALNASIRAGDVFR